MLIFHLLLFGPTPGPSLSASRRTRRGVLKIYQTFYPATQRVINVNINSTGVNACAIN